MGKPTELIGLVKIYNLIIQARALGLEDGGQVFISPSVIDPMLNMAEFNCSLSGVANGGYPFSGCIGTIYGHWIIVDDQLGKDMVEIRCSDAIFTAQLNTD